MLSDPSHGTDQPVRNAFGEYLAAYLEPDESWLSALRKLEHNPVDTPHLTAFSVDEFLVENVTDYAHIILRRISEVESRQSPMRTR